MSAEDVELTRAMLRAVNRAAETGNHSEYLRYLSDDVIWEAVEDAPDAGTYVGHKGIRGYLQDWLDTVDGAQWEAGQITDEGGFLVADTRFRARIKGTDNEMKLDYSLALQIEGGKIARAKEFWHHDEATAYARSAG